MSTGRPRYARDVAAVLLAALEGDEASFDVPVRGARFTGLADAATFHGIVGYAHRVVARAPWVPECEREALDSLAWAALVRHLLTLDDLRTASAVLDGAGVDWIVLKGPVLAEHYHGSPALRSYRDLDLLVPGGQLRDALDAFEDAGFAVLDRNWTLLRRERRGEVHLVLTQGTVVDLHWHLVNEGRVRDAFSVPSAALFERMREIEVGPLRLRTLDPVDTLLHLGLHTTLSGGHRLVWSKDIERVIARDRPDWDEVVGRARAWDVGFPVAGALATARSVAGADVPASVLRALCPSAAWRMVTALSDRISPGARSSGGGSVHRLVARSTRGDAQATAREMLRRSGAWLVGRSRPAAERWAPGPLDPSSPGSLHYPRGGIEQRDAFLADVERTVRDDQRGEGVTAPVDRPAPSPGP